MWTITKAEFKIKVVVHLWQKLANAALISWSMCIYDFLFFCNDSYTALYQGHHDAPRPKSCGSLFYAVVVHRTVHLSGRRMETHEKLRTGKRIPATQSVNGDWKKNKQKKKVFSLHSVTEAVCVSDTWQAERRFCQWKSVCVSITGWTL